MQECFPKANKIEIEEKDFVEGHQHYVGDIIRLTLKYEEDGTERKKYLIFKVPKDGVSAAVFSGLDFIVRESFVYDKIIPLINEYLDEALAPNYYKTIDSKIIVLDNLVEFGYDGGENNRQLCGLDECLSILKALADFHATTHKVLQTKPNLLEPKMFQYSPILEFRQTLAAFYEPILVELLVKNDASFLIPKLKKANSCILTDDGDIASRVHYSNFKFNTLNHGDFRKDNVLLKYGPNNSVEGVKFVDFQTCFWSTPVYDFMYFIIESAKWQVIDNHYETLLDWYLKCLNEKLEKLNCPQVYQRQHFEEDIKKLDICFFIHVLVAAVMLCPSDRNKLLDEVFQGNKENTDYYMEACLKDEIFTSSILSGLKLCHKLGLF